MPKTWDLQFVSRENIDLSGGGACDLNELENHLWRSPVIQVILELNG